MTKITIDKALIEQAISALLREALGVDNSALRQKLREALAEPAPEPVTEVVDYILQDDIHNRLTPRVVDIAHSAFMLGRIGINSDDDGPCDWFNDTKPTVMKQIAKIKKDLAEAAAPVRKPSPQPPADVPMIEPIPPEKITDHIRGMDADMLEDLCAFSFERGVRWAEKQHGIGGG